MVSLLPRTAIRCLSFSRTSFNASATNASDVVYRVANKRDKPALVRLACNYVLEDEHYKGIGGTAEETMPYWDYLIRDALRNPHSYVAYDKSGAIGFSLITVRNREMILDRMETLGAPPPRTSFSLLCDVCDAGEKLFWSMYPEAHKVFVNETIYVTSEYRRLGVGSTLVNEQYYRLKEYLKKGNKVDGFLAVATSYANVCQLEKIGFKRIAEMDPALYKRQDGSTWKSADPQLPYALLMFLKKSD